MVNAKQVIAEFDETALEANVVDTLTKKVSAKNYHSISLALGQTSRTMEIRFLPNYDITNNVMKPTQWTISEKHWVSVGDSELDGFIDCQNHTGKNSCPLCKAYWKAYKAGDMEKANSIKRNQKYYAYALIVNDPEHPELNGHIQVLQFTYQVFEKIQNAINGSLGEKFNPFSPKLGANFVYVIARGKQTFPNYNNSYFKGQSVIDLMSLYKKEVLLLPTLESFISVPTPEATEKMSKILQFINHEVKFVPSSASDKHFEESMEVVDLDSIFEN